MIRAEALSKSYGSKVALEALSFSIGPGEIVGFLGPNGAGKTTTMRILTGYLAASSGSAAIAGHDVLLAPLAARRAVGYLPEEPPVYPEMSVAAYLRFCGELRGLPRAEAQAAAEAAGVRCGLKDESGRRIEQLSRGYRQRVGIAQALVHSPSVLILDEPTVALDPEQIQDIRALLKELATEESTEGGPRRTILLCTHRLEDVTATCSRVIILAQGQMLRDESLEEATARGSLEEHYLELTHAARSGATP